MPHTVIHLSGALDASLAHAAVEAVSQLTQTILGKKPEVISTTVQFIPSEHWFVGGQSLAALGKSAYHLEISVTDETNTKQEKAHYLQAVQAAFATLRPDLHALCYTHVVDARAAAYGYGGHTQEYRHQRAESPPTREHKAA